MPKNQFSILTTAMIKADGKKGQTKEIDETSSAKDRAANIVGIACGLIASATVGAVIGWRILKNENKSED